MQIKPYENKYVKAMAQLFYDTVHTVCAKDYTQKQLDAWAPETIDLDLWDKSFSAHNSLVAIDAGEVVGFADMDGNGYLDRLYVHKNYQGQGVATALVNELEKVAKEKGIACILTHASKTALPFFRSMGYVVQQENTAVRKGVELTNFIMTKFI